ncbi:hypothetical protein L873DRAFT_1706077 [Choiromyces venosus 120613-1]|uniref:C2H2-type domain-containing protein n=1 Tax=Choiromyces venosus 120613-1 TaxID=1336337 RepID=A0A3N4J4J7_9PEZI|nr:hypothetical protein L873DRAFT_1706077 [Choiromyces venosus 120613-1]
MESTTQSSSATSPPPKSKPRKFFCNYEGCGKAFTRAEHLQRHELNHRPSPNTCKRCRAHFARPDLLDRHMERHAQKDKLAGGEGLGVLVTRKRCWRDDNGNITDKRPATSLASLPKPTTSPKSQTGKGREESGSGSDETGNMSGGDGCTSTTVPVSPPYSTASSARRQRNDGGHGHNRSPPAATTTANAVRAFDQLQSQQLELAEPGMFENETFRLPPPPPPQTYQLDPLLSDHPPSAAEVLLADYQVEYDEVFSADPASSFTMPFTTLGNYTWLFDELDSPTGTRGQSGYHDFQGLGELDKISPVEDHSLYFPSDAQPISHDIPSRDSHTATMTNITRHSPSSEPVRTLFTPHTQYSIPATSSPTSNCNNFHSYASTSASASESPSPTLSFQPLPKIDEVARSEVLSLIIQATTNASGEPQFSWNDPLLSLSALQNYLDLFFSRFNPSYPLLHRPSFEPSNVNKLLLVSVLMLGATYGEKDAHHMAVRVHDVLRGVLVSSDYFHATPELWVLQTVLLIEVFGKSRACMKQHDMAHLFHGLLINLIRRSDCQTSTPLHISLESKDLDQEWREWIIAEEKKRLALLAFLWDVQHAVLFSQSLCMSAFELRLPLPYDSPTWEANSAEAWYKARKAERPPPPFLMVIKLYLNPGKTTPALNSFSRLLILHGLMSVMWDMKRRDQTSLDSSLSTTSWQSRIATAYDAWKLDFDSHPSPSMSSSGGINTETATSTLTLYHAAHLILHTDILSLQIYAGARSILGKPVLRTDYDSSCAVVKAWSMTHAARKSVYHAAAMIRNSLQPGTADDGRSHYPWCLYLATLVCWAGCGGVKEEIVWDAKGEMRGFVEGIFERGRDRKALASGGGNPAGMIAVVAKYLGGIRWALVQEGTKVLRGLIAGRLLKEDEAFM